MSQTPPQNKHVTKNKIIFFFLKKQEKKTTSVEHVYSGGTLVCEKSLSLVC